MLVFGDEGKLSHTLFLFFFLTDISACPQAAPLPSTADSTRYEPSPATSQPTPKFLTLWFWASMEESGADSSS